MNKVVEYVIKAKDLVSATLGKIGQAFSGTAGYAKKAEKSIKDLTAAKKADQAASQGLQEVLKGEAQKIEDEKKRVELLKEATERLTAAKKRLKEAKYSADTEAIKREIAELEGATKSLADNGFGGLEKRIGGFGGQLSSVLGKIGKFGGQAAAVIGAWKIGQEIGEKICDWFEIGPKYVRERLIKENKAIAEEQKKVIEDFVAHLDDVDAKTERNIGRIDKELKEVDDLAAAYKRLESAKNAAADADAKGDELKLRGEKFDAMRKAATPEEKQKIGLEYDIKLAELSQKQAVEKYDREATLADKAAEQLDEKLSKLNDKRFEIERGLQSVSKEQKQVDKLFSAGEINADGAAEADKRLADTKREYTKQLEDIEREIAQAEAEVEALGQDKANRGKVRANLEEQMRQEVKAREAALEDFNLKQEEEYEKQLAEEYKAWLEEQEKMQAEQDRLRAEELKAEQDMQRKIHQQRLADAKSELAESERNMATMQSELAAAKSEVQKAWGWYKNTDSMQKEIDAYEEQKKAEEQWAKDFEKLRSKYGSRGWRSVEFGKMSAQEEATRQVALAKEREQAAQKALDEIAENTTYLKEIAEALSSTEEA